MEEILANARRYQRQICQTNLTARICPWCGSERTRVTFGGRGPGNKFWVTCNDCHAGGPHQLTPDAAVETWNDR